MSFDNFILYSITAFLAAISPGPSVIFAINTAAHHGMRLALLSALGNTTAILILSVISAIGLGTIIGASDILYNMIKLIGSLYLIYLGIKIFFETGILINKNMNSLHPLRSKIFFRSFWISMGNPKIILFLISLFPAFIEQEDNQAVQLAILSLTFVFFTFSTLVIYILFSNFFLKKIKNNSLITKFSSLLFSSLLFSSLYRNRREHSCKYP